MNNASKKQLRTEYRLASLKGHIENIYRNLEKNTYYERRFDKQFIAELTRKKLLRKGIQTLWDDRKLYELAFNTIEYLYTTLPEFTKLSQKHNISKREIAHVYGFKSYESFENATNKPVILDHFTKAATLILSKIA